MSLRDNYLTFKEKVLDNCMFEVSELIPSKTESKQKNRIRERDKR